MAHVLGIDIGGTGIKAAPVDVATGRLRAQRLKLPTPHPATPDAVVQVVSRLSAEFGLTGTAGITFPGVVTDGTVQTAPNLDPAWISVGAAELFGKATGLTVTVLLLTFGTGIGSALFYDQVLVPNTEFGHIELHGQDAEARASERAREEGDLSWGKWAGRVDEYIDKMEQLLSPDLIIVGGGISKKSSKFLPRVTTIRARVVPAALLNDAGIVGAAMAAAMAAPH